MKNRYKMLLLSSVLWLTACATTQQELPDYSALERNRPHSLLVLPPLNSSVDPHALPAVLAASVQPLAELGYYVVPVANMMEVFQHNGMQEAQDIHAIAPNKLREIFGADAALYLTIDTYGSRYVVLDSVTEVGADAKLINLRSGDVLWQGRVDHAIGQNNNNNGLLGMLVGALVGQIANTVSDSAWPASQQAMTVLFRNQRGLPSGPRRADAPRAP